MVRNPSEVIKTRQQAGVQGYNTTTNNKNQTVGILSFFKNIIDPYQQCIQDYES